MGTWTPIAESGIAFEFIPAGISFGTLEMPASTVVGVNVAPSNTLDDTLWEITFSGNVNLYPVRVTALSFSMNTDFGAVTSPAAVDSNDTEAQMEQTGETTMTPSQITISEAINCLYQWPAYPGEFANQSSFQFLIEIEIPDPPPVPGEPYIIRNTARVYRGAVNNVKAWIRTEEGKLDLSAFTTLQAVIWSGSGGAFRDGYTPGAWMWPNSGQNLLFTVPVTSPELGLALFQLPPSGNTLRWIPSSLCYTILGDGVPLATGLIEVVG